MSRRARPRKAHRLRACSSDAQPGLRPSAHSPRCWRAPSAREPSSPRVRRSFLREPAAGSIAEGSLSAPAGARPSSHRDRTAGLTPPGSSRTAARARPAATPVPARSPVPTGAASAPAAAPQPRSSARPRLGPCPGSVARAPRSACGRRSPDTGSAPGRPLPRSASAGLLRPARPRAASDAGGSVRANARGAGRVDETPLPWAAHGEPTPIWDCVTVSGTWSGTSMESIRYARNWDCASCRRSRAITPMKSVPCTPNWDCATSHGSWLNGAGNRSGSGFGSRRSRSSIRRTVK